MPSPRYDCEYNVAGYDEGYGGWRFGSAFKRKDGKWDFYVDGHVKEREYRQVLKPRHIKIYGVIRC